MARAELRNETAIRDEFLSKLGRDRKRTVERTLALYEVVDKGDYRAAFSTAVDSGKLPIIVSNHQSIADGIALGNITEGMSKPVRLPIAASITEGEQGELIQLLVAAYGPELRKRNLDMVSVVTERDRQVRGMSGQNKEMFNLLLKSPSEGYGFAIFPEQTVEGGRKDDDGTIKGMQYLERDKNLVAFMKKWIKQGFQLVILPVGIDRGNTTLDPDKKTVEAISVDAAEMILGYRGLVPMASITVGAPVEIDAVESGLTDHHFMRMIAPLVSEEARGAYTSW